ncbi:MAG: fumarylacetoacetate hydrolase family protein, partial [Halalkalicoccus sp.]|nr:fumarylacetoacetate hydrolase family protein [Halalkalicoccus sp.]
GELPDPGALPVRRVPGEKLSFGMPIARGALGKCWGIGLNYEEHAGDLGEARPEEPASFMKPRTAVTGPGGPIRLPPREETERVTAEGELAVLLGRTAGNVDDPDEVIAGYLPVIDMTAEDVLERNPRFLTRAKSFDTFL